ncbi:unnamed protein product [Kuraishia capsulata CBS 1993]|uniref:20S-pre-rRNA D-site endonuclease NOB1 n=1 Tax=Kuraishia capsulata CBS 1993 TaxID=1382522 RepID=W6MSZ9_9ASCO|nr:uncharacterized protein KUCA_T00005843001 [Kuraishia capsulata CBS 1993]CDK29849.1 unnamed protein product [Kuraishia capsulata CBS 1993]
MSRVNTLVLDAGPLINQPAASLQQYASNFVTTPGVFAELKDENVRQQVVLWGDSLKIRHPKSASIKAVVDFARLTGDSAVLSTNDIHVIALAYEIECEMNNGDWRLRKYPGEKKMRRVAKTDENEEKESTNEAEKDVQIESKSESNQGCASEPEPNQQSAAIKKPRRRGGKRHKKKTDDTELAAGLELVSIKEDEWEVVGETGKKENTGLSEEYDLEDDETEWITTENVEEEIVKDQGEQIEQETSRSMIKVALATGDFACQNVALQIGLNLMNTMSGMRIKRVRNYMLRCHACFRLTAIPKDGRPKHFCSSCGGATLLRCAVSVDSKTGMITPHLKKNFQWFTRGNKYSLPSPLSKAQNRRVGNAGYQHKRENNHQEILLLREDQKEYQQAVKDEMWQRRQNDKHADEWIGGGSADGYVSPFFSDQIRPSGVKVNRGRHANAVRKPRS